MDDRAREAVITCPACGTRTAASMPENACVFFWECPACRAVVRPKRAEGGSEGDCCVFCSYSDAPCPPVQRARSRTDNDGSDAPTSCCTDPI